MTERALSGHETGKQLPSRKGPRGRALQRTSDSQEGTEKQEGGRVLKMGSEHPKVR